MIEGEYSFDHQAVVKLNIEWDTDKISMDVNVQDITSNHTQQTAKFVLPGIGDVDIEFGHDFRNKKKKTFTVIGQLMGRESFLKAEWNRNKDFTKLSGKIDALSILLGKMEVTVDYDIRNIHNAKAEINYKRNDDKFMRLNWFRIYDNNKLNAEVTFESHFRRVPAAKLTINIDMTSRFVLDASLQVRNKIIKVDFTMGGNNIHGEITTPFKNFEKLTGNIDYDFSNRKKKSVILRYNRGDKAVTMDFNLDLASKKAGSLTFKLTTPFELAKTVDMNASWKNGNGNVTYQRNGIEYTFSGKADVKSSRSAFEVTFDSPGNDPVKFAFEFNSGSLVSGKGTGPEKLAEVEIQLLGKRVAFEIEGFRDNDRLMLKLDAESSLEHLREFELLLDSELNLQKREGLFEMKLNDFHFRIKNNFERKPEGFYVRSEVNSSLTPLPGIILGVGKDGEACILTVGLGEDREVTVSFASKNNFREGFSGKLSLPRRGIIDAAYDVTYNFQGNNLLNTKINLQLEPGKVIEADILYNSDGVRARVSSIVGRSRRSVRVKRSIADQSFAAELDIDDYTMSLRGNSLKSDIQKGFLIEGEIFGRKFSIDTLLQINGRRYSEGKFIVSTNIPGYESLGGLFTFSNIDKTIQSRAEINLPSYITPKVYLNIDFDYSHNMHGMINVDASGQIFSADVDLAKQNSGYTGHIILTTPFHRASEVAFRGEVTVLSLKNMNIVGTLSTPMTSTNVLLNYALTEKSIDSEMKFECGLTQKYVHVIFNAESNITHRTGRFSYNDNEISVGYIYKPGLQRAYGNLNIRTLLQNPISTSFDFQLDRYGASSLDLTMKGTEEHNFSFSYNKAESELTLSTLVSSSFVGGRHAIHLKHIMPRSYLYESFSFQLSYTHAESYVLDLGAIEQGVLKYYLKFNSPAGVYSAEVLPDPEDYQIIITNPNNGLHKLNVKYDVQIGQLRPHLTGSVKLFAELSSTLLQTNIKYSADVDMSETKKISTQLVEYGKYREELTTKYEYTSRGVVLELDGYTSLFDIGKINVASEIKTGKIMRAVIKVLVQESTHSFDVKVNTAEKSISMVAKSPAVKGNVVKAEASMTGTSLEDLSFDVLFRYDRDTYASLLEVKAPTFNDVNALLEVKTPLKGYRKMKFGVLYDATNDDAIRARVFADKPIGYKLDFISGKEDGEHVSELSIETPVDKFKRVKILANIPIKKISPKILIELPNAQYALDFEANTHDYTRTLAGNVNLNGLKYGAGLEIRNKAPYELAYSYKVQDILTRFHVMMDSSIFSIVSLFL